MSFLIVLFLASAYAQAVPTLSWDECIQRAAQNNAALQAAESDWRSAKAQVGASRAGFFPSVSASVNETREVNRADNTDGTSYGVSVSASQNLFSGLADHAKVKQSKFDLDAAGATLQTAKANLSYDLKSQFEGLHFAESSLKLADDIIKRREENLKLVQLRFESGGENKGSVLLSKANLEQAKLGRLEAVDVREVAIASLKKVLGWEDTGDFEISGTVPVHDPDAKLDFRELALGTPDLKQAQAKEQKADAGVTLARAGFFPKLDLSGSSEKRSGVFFPQGDHWKVGVALTLPFFDGGKDYYGTKAAAAAWKSAQHNSANVKADTLAKLKRLYTAYVEAVQKLKVDESFQKAAQVRAEIARNKYNNGLLSFDDWDLIESDLISREKTYLESRRDRVVAEAAWEQALGKGVIR